jgi:hypothetical protein
MGLRRPTARVNGASLDNRPFDFVFAAIIRKLLMENLISRCSVTFFVMAMNDLPG